MTVRDVYEAVLIELNKVQAPSLLVDDFVYYLNKAVQEYFNKRYNVFEKNQQATDDLSRLIKMHKVNPDELTKNTNSIYKTVWEVKLPDDYVHILNCTCVFMGNSKCTDCNEIVQGANKLDTNQASQILTNYYMKPSIYRPYYYIINVNDPTQINSTPEANRQSGTRYGNSTQPIMQILCGNDIKHPIKYVQIAYLRAPQYLSISSDDLDQITDNTKVLEFQDYVVNEIIKEIVKMVLENGSDARIQTFIPVNQSVPQQ